MAQNHYSDFCLPPHFLTDEQTPFRNRNDAVSTTNHFPYFTSLTLTEQQQHINELTRLMTHSSLNNNNINKGIFVNDLNQSKLNEYENGRFWNGSSQNDDVLKLNLQRARYDLLHAVAEEDERFRIRQVNNNNKNEEEAFHRFVPKKPLEFHSQNHQRALSQKQLQSQIAQFEMLKKQWLKQREEFVRSNGVFTHRECGNYQNVPRKGRNNETVFQGNVGLSSSGGAAAWSSLKSGSNNNKSVFHGNPNFKKERNGTGVFLPRSVDSSTTESKKKQACKNKNVVVPERVINALNRKVDEGMLKEYMQLKNRFYGISNNENGVGKIGGENGISQQNWNGKAQHTEGNLEIRLPQEWTY